MLILWIYHWVNDHSTTMIVAVFYCIYWWFCLNAPAVFSTHRVQWMNDILIPSRFAPFSSHRICLIDCISIPSDLEAISFPIWCILLFPFCSCLLFIDCWFVVFGVNESLTDSDIGEYTLCVSRHDIELLNCWMTECVMMYCWWRIDTVSGWKQWTMNIVPNLASPRSIVDYFLLSKLYTTLFYSLSLFLTWCDSTKWQSFCYFISNTVPLPFIICSLPLMRCL